MSGCETVREWHDLLAQVAVAKTGKYATRESGDTVETVERPNGGLSVVMADGQRSGRSAKVISNVVVRKALSLLAEGVRDGAAARAAHDYLRTSRSGQVSATLNILSLDLATGTVVISRNSHCPALVIRGGQVMALDEPSEAVGIHPRVKPAISELPIEADLCVVAFTDGVQGAGHLSGGSWDVASFVGQCLAEGVHGAPDLADAILLQARALDAGRPRDDMSVAVLWLLQAEGHDGARRLQVSVPLGSH
ncbi:MAG: SpoIIE family protein phosphatase [Chloroflexi bacterium]|nr:SpoIIE family protein phosphatase [Chloroflexota bacterium]